MNKGTGFFKSSERLAGFHQRVWSVHHIWPSLNEGDIVFPQRLSLIPEDPQLRYVEELI